MLVEFRRRRLRPGGPEAPTAPRTPDSQAVALEPVAPIEPVPEGARERARRTRVQVASPVPFALVERRRAEVLRAAPRAAQALARAVGRAAELALRLLFVPPKLTRRTGPGLPDQEPWQFDPREGGRHGWPDRQ